MRFGDSRFVPRSLTIAYESRIQFLLKREFSVVIRAVAKSGAWTSISIPFDAPSR